MTEEEKKESFKKIYTEVNWYITQIKKDIEKENDLKEMEIEELLNAATAMSSRLEDCIDYIENCIDYIENCIDYIEKLEK